MTEFLTLYLYIVNYTYIVDISDVTRLTGRMQRNLTEVFIGSPDQDDKKVGVTVFVSTDQEGVMYEVHGKIRRLAKYQYTARCLQVCNWLKPLLTVSAQSQIVSHRLRPGNFNWAQTVILSSNGFCIHNV